MAREPLLFRSRRVVRTLARLHPMQVAFRPVHETRMALLRRSSRLAAILAGSSPGTLGPPLLNLRDSLSQHLVGIEPELARARSAIDGTARLVGRSLRLNPPLTDFSASSEPKLVRYQLAYLGAVRSLAIAARTRR